MIEDNTTHFTPKDDIKPHKTFGTDCHCSPVVYPAVNNGLIVVHYAFDGREFADDTPTVPNAINHEVIFYSAFVDKSHKLPYDYRGH